MPLLQTQDTYTLRIQAGQVEIRRVYLDSTLLGGLYDVTYHLAGGTQGSNPIKEYVWGVADENLPKPSWPNQTYYTKFQGWYEGATYVTAISIITKDFHKDLNLYAKGTQRRYTYSGTYTGKWTERVGVGGGGTEAGESRTTPPDSSDPYDIDNDHDGEDAMPNCTGYVNHRCREYGLPSPYALTGPPAGEWGAVNGGAGSSERHAGDIACGTDHVAFCEPNGTTTGSYYSGSSYIPQSIRDKKSLDVYNYVVDHYGLSGYRWWHQNSKGNGGGRGYLHYEGGGSSEGGEGGHGEYISKSKTVSVPETECTSQKSPSLSTPARPGDVPSDASGSGTSTLQNTYTRDYNYSSNSGGGGTLASSGSWDTSGSDWI